MKIGLIGLGKMGYNLALNLRDRGHEVIAYNRSTDKIKKIEEEEGIKGAFSLETLTGSLEGRKILWMMIPAGPMIDILIESLIPLLKQGDILIDGGNSNYLDTLRRAERLKMEGIDYVDVGTSGGVEGARNGACMMIGATEEVFDYLKPIFQDVCLEKGYAHVGKPGTGHYVKMIHNGIEYGMMQAIGEGFEILEKSGFDFDYKQIAQVWNHGSVIRGWLMELTQKVFEEDPSLKSIKGVIHSSGEGLWTVEEALRLKVPAPVITDSLFVRYRSEQQDTFSGKLIAGLRYQFGGHSVEKA
ncbi:6-phosphogluconate dehydrogenase (decarboxylating) [Geosporobacter subterraneus DSM 17957]|uniref:6-phosphogluconate dehydrogenase (Decarboxylating) n=1 Tax=Geosporobacter subterraneus DSM 17957 TaxID=1121919 RepID=A0A1M6F5D3_9FIRM|nr:decarboxylating 6-phosphogluconate dehydrogenase [Geosporobacter subterraneus]SHI92944.1 6-phosphogluconate dehydrogenase (decarboxylating) [Geosporobacter subterraneus DSM 17957]